MRTLLLILLLLPSIAQAHLRDGLIGWWKFDEGTGTSTSANSVWGGTAATLANSPTWVFNTPRTNGLKFNGTNQGASAAVDLSGTNKASLSFWMLWDNFAADTDDLAFEYTANYNSANGIIVDPNTATTFNIQIHRTAVGYNGGFIARPSALVWHHYVFLFDRTVGAANGVTAYVDNVLQSMTNTVTTDMGSTNFDNSTLYFMSRNVASLFGAGQLDDVRLYNRLITVQEVKNLYNDGIRRGYVPGA